jgi:hypothetical protein
MSPRRSRLWIRAGAGVALSRRAPPEEPYDIATCWSQPARLPTSGWLAAMVA